MCTILHRLIPSPYILFKVIHALIDNSNLAQCLWTIQSLTCSHRPPPQPKTHIVTHSSVFSEITGFVRPYLYDHKVISTSRLIIFNLSPLCHRILFRSTICSMHKSKLTIIYGPRVINNTHLSQVNHNNHLHAFSFKVIT